MGGLGGVHDCRAGLFADALARREHMDQPGGNHHGDEGGNHRDDKDVALDARLALTSHMGTLHRRVGGARPCSVGITNIVGAHDLGNAGVDLGNADRMGLIGRKRVHDARRLRVCFLERGIARGGIADLVGGGREHLLVNLGRDSGNHRADGRTDKGSGNADDR